MKSSLGMLITCLAFVFSALSCDKDTATANKPASEYFPNSVGNNWEYDVYDSSSARMHSDFPREYTVKVSIIGNKTLLDNSKASIWLYQYPWGTDTNYVSVVSDTVKIYDPFRIKDLHGLLFPLRIYILPFAAEKRWDGKLLLIDSFHIYTEHQVSLLHQSFTDCFRMYHYYLAPNIENIDNYWFKPNIGMLKIYYSDYNNAPYDIYLWQLKSYSLH